MAGKRPCKFMDSWLAKKSQSESTPVSSAAERADSVGLNSTTVNTLPAVPHETTDSAYTLLSELENGCFQPDDLSALPVQIINGKTRAFQLAWFKRFPWLHYSKHLNAILCFTCVKATALSLMDLSTKTQQTFVTTGRKPLTSSTSTRSVLTTGMQ